MKWTDFDCLIMEKKIIYFSWGGKKEILPLALECLERGSAL